MDRRMGLANRDPCSDNATNWPHRADREPGMLFLARVILYAGAIAAIGYGALYALGALVQPEPREIVITVPMPKRS
jgi:hypothetical protein